MTDFVYLHEEEELTKEKWDKILEFHEKYPLRLTPIPLRPPNTDDWRLDWLRYAIMIRNRGGK